jgi:hypothetical protein
MTLAAEAEALHAEAEATLLRRPVVVKFCLLVAGDPVKHNFFFTAPSSYIFYMNRSRPPTRLLRDFILLC